ncbi:hypothetical protein BGW39_009768 [Mortierella sp. 14UC]|nr:hypothetical protein BGW39_009768 [Mortierella sp. 14UC]
MPYYLSPPMAKYLTEQPVALTTLNIIQVYHNLHCIHYGWLANYLDRGSGYVPITWHRLLCESSNLRHLKTLKMPYMTDYMDLHRRSVIYSKAVPSVIVPGVWICRGLERLHLDLHTHEHATARGSHQTRIAYGYIARVCPHLQDLRIRFPGNCEFFEGYAQWKHHPFVLEGGLCLLSGLKCLERLRLEYRTVECEIAELNWLCQSGRNEEHRVRRRQLVEGWLWRLEHEAKLEADRLQSTAGAAIGLLGPGADDEKLMASLASLGLLQDVKDVMVTMDKYGFVCLPSLQLLACGDHLPQRPEKEMRSLFYVEPLGLIERLSNYSPF